MEGRQTGRYTSAGLERVTVVMDLPSAGCFRCILFMNTTDAITEPTCSPSDAPPIPVTLTQDLRGVLKHAAGRSLRIEDLLGILRERGYIMVLLLVTLPFMLPVPTMGLSIPAGIAIMLYGVSQIFGTKPWLPGFLARREISHAALQKIVNLFCRITTRLENTLRPRFQFMFWPGMNVLIGGSLIFLAFCMSLPLPLPFTNGVPAFGITLLLLGLIERDGLFVLLGMLMCVVIAVMLYFIWDLVVDLFHHGASLLGWARLNDTHAWWTMHFT